MKRFLVILCGLLLSAYYVPQVEAGGFSLNIGRSFVPRNRVVVRAPFFSGRFRARQRVIVRQRPVIVQQRVIRQPVIQQPVFVGQPVYSSGYSGGYRSFNSFNSFGGYGAQFNTGSCYGGF